MAGSVFTPDGFSDDFEDGVLAPEMPAYSNGVDESDGTLNVAPSSLNEWRGVSVTDELRPMENKRLAVEIPEVSSEGAYRAYFQINDTLTGTGHGMGVHLSTTGDDRILLMVDYSPGAFLMNYDPVAMRWWSLRGEGGHLYFETSADGVTWENTTEIGATELPTWGWDLSTAGFGLEMGARATVGTTRFDNLSLGPARMGLAGVILAEPTLLDYWRLGDPSGPGFAADSKGALQLQATGAGTTFGVPGLIPGDADTAVLLDGTSALYVQPAPDLTNGFAVEILIDPDAAGFGANQNMLAATSAGIAIAPDGHLNAWVLKGGVNIAADGPVLASGSTYRVGAEFDGTTLRLYLEGVEVASTPVAAPIDASAELDVGAYPGGFDLYHGVVDEAAVYSSLGADRFLAHYEAALGPPAVPVGVTAAAGDGQVELSWPVSDRATGYQVRRDGALVYDGAATSFLDAGLINGTSYSYTVLAYDADWQSAESAPLAASPVAPAPPPPPPAGQRDLTGRPEELLADLPPILRDDPDIQAVQVCYGREAERIESTIAALRAELNPLTATDWGLALYETTLELPVRPAGQTLDQRRDVIVSVLRRTNLGASGSDWVIAVTKIVGPGWSYEEHDPDDPSSPPAYTIRITLPFAPTSDLYARLERQIRKVTAAHLDLVLASAAGFVLDESQLDQGTLTY